MKATFFFPHQARSITAANNKNKNIIMAVLLSGIIAKKEEYYV
jgi:hypothetical protein